MKISRVLVIALLPVVTQAAWADHRSDVLVGGALGGVLGSVIGSEIGGRDGAVVGAGLGALAGVAMTSDDGGHYRDHYARGRDRDDRRYVTYRDDHREYHDRDDYQHRDYGWHHHDDDRRYFDRD